MDVIHDALPTARPGKYLTVVDNRTRQTPTIRVAHSIRGRHVAEALERLRLRGRKPKRIVADNGPEFVVARYGCGRFGTASSGA
jgi:transposase InsO family protein